MAIRTKRKRKYAAQNQKSAYLFILPSMIILSVFVFIPLIASFVISITNMNIFMQNIEFVGLRNFARLFTDDRVTNATFNSLYFTLLEVPLQVGLALLLTVCLAKNNRYCKMLRSIYYLPFVCSMTAIGIVWSMLLDPNMGLVEAGGTGDGCFLERSEVRHAYGDRRDGLEGIWLYADASCGGGAQHTPVALRSGTDGRSGELPEVYSYYHPGDLVNHQLLYCHDYHKCHADV